MLRDVLEILFEIHRDSFEIMTNRKSQCSGRLDITEAVELLLLRTEHSIQQAIGGRPPQYAPPQVTLTFDLLSLKVVSESRVTLATSVPILVFLGLSVLRPDVRDRQTDVRQHHCLMPPPTGRGIINSSL